MDLKSFRENTLKIKTQSEFAELIGVDQSSISRWEKDPDNMPLQVIIRILDKTGASFEELTGWNKYIPMPLTVNSRWENIRVIQQVFLTYIADFLQKGKISDEYQKRYIEEMRVGIAANLVKPKLVIAGRSDTGKSMLTNALLGTDKMPAAWAPTTSIAVYVKDISDKPAFMEEDVWIFASQLGNESMWDEHRLYDESYCRSWKISAGGAELLRSFGTRQGENNARQAGCAVMFLDAPILKTCDIIDLPGIWTGMENEDNIAFSMANKADLLVYLSQARNFMGIQDIAYLKNSVSLLPVWENAGENSLNPLCNLFVVATQAHMVNNGNRVLLEEILDNGCRSLMKMLPDGYWMKRQKLSGYPYGAYTSDEMRARFFAYTVDIPEICIPFEEALREILEASPDVVAKRAKHFVWEYIQSKIKDIAEKIQEYQNLLVKREQYTALLEQVQLNWFNWTSEQQNRQKEVCALLQKAADSSIKEFNQYVTQLLDMDALIQLMEDKGVKNKKEDIVLFGSTVQSMMQQYCEELIAQNSRLFWEKVKVYLDGYLKNAVSPVISEIGSIDFNPERLFLSALSAVGSVGISDIVSAGALSNGRAISKISVASLAVGMVTSTIFGPIGITFGFLMSGVLGVAKLLGNNWKKNVCRKIIGVFQEHQIQEQLCCGMRAYWAQTRNSFMQAAAQLDREWETYVSNLHSTLQKNDAEDIRQKVGELQALSDFFGHFPL